MSDYIKREDALFALCSTVHCGEEVPCRNQIVSCQWNATRVQDYAESILLIPAAAVAPVKHGKWKRMSPWSEGVGMGESYGYYYSCSECEKQVQGDYKTCGFAYCPNCGARMEGDNG